MAIDLEQALADLADSLEFPGADGLAERVRAELDRPVTVTPLLQRPVVRRTLALAAAAIVIVGVVLVASPRARRAVADLLGIGGIEIRSSEAGPATSIPVTFPPRTIAPPSTVPAAASASTAAGPSLSGPVSVEDGAAALGIPPPVPALLGPPAAVTLDDGRLSLEWPPSPALPPTGLPGVGGLLTVFRAEVEEGFFVKILEPGTTYERVSVNGGPAAWLGGEPHVFLYRTTDGSGSVEQETLRLAGNTLIWTAGPFTYRLESDLDRDGAIAVAETVPVP